MAAVSPTPSQLSALESEHVIILGAGASGLAAAVLLARDHNVKVTVYERMDDLAQADEESYPIGVNPRGMKVLKMISPAMEDAIDVAAGKVAGWSIFDGKAGKQIALLKSGTVVGTTRGKVVSELYKAAADTAGVTMMLGHKLIKADTSSRTLTFAKGSGEEVLVDYSASGTRVLDCTGCFSKLRTAVASTDPTFAVAATPWEISFRCLFTSDPPKATNLDPALHYIFTTAGIYAAVLTGSRWVFSLSVNPTMGLGDMKWLLEETATDENIARLKAHIATHLPQAVGMLEEDEYKAFFTRRSFTGQVTKLNRLNQSEEIAFLGDAAHAGEQHRTRLHAQSLAALSANISLLTLPRSHTSLCCHSLTPSPLCCHSLIRSHHPSHTFHRRRHQRRPGGRWRAARRAHRKRRLVCRIQPRAARRRECAVRLGGVSP